jgi:branched-subunit amino acid ABC-type transport system permease component
MQLCVNDISPSPEAFGMLNALALALVSGIRSFAPVLFASLYALGVDRQVLRGEFFWVILIACAVAFGVALRWLPERAEGRPKQQGVEQEA